MADNIIRYNSKTFTEIKEDLIAYIKQTYSDIYGDFIDSNIGTLLIDLNAGVGNNLSMNTSRAFQETQLENAQLRSSILNHAKTMGFNIPSKRPSATIVDFTVLIPVLGDGPDSSYYPVLSSGAQVVGGGKIFETQNIIDWSSPLSSLGDPNRSIIPNKDSNGIIVSYSVQKREVVVNGSTSIYKKIITSNDVFPFFSITLPDPDVLEIDSVILLEGTNFNNNPNDSEFYNSNNRYYEVDYLAQQSIFIEKNSGGLSTDNTFGLKTGIWFDVTKKFIKEFDPKGYCKITFGSGDSDVNAFKSGFLKEGVSNKYFLDNFLNNTALGEKLKANYTLFIKYRTGGGVNSNVGVGVLNQLSNFTLRVSGSRQDLNQSVQRSIKVNNPIPAIGGNDGLSVEQIRNLIKYNFSSQNRCVTPNDYLVQVNKMPGKFGSPFRVNVYKENNKVVIPIISLGSDGKLLNSSNTLMKDNISEYLSKFKEFNDYVEIKDGKIFNLGYDIDVYVDNISNNQIINAIVNVIKDYHNINNHNMNEDIFVGDLQNKILDVNGVINVISIRAYNKVGGSYSNNVTSQELLSDITGEIRLINNTIYSTEDSMFEIRYPEKDIKVNLKKLA
jgi:hypothetical protein